MFDHHRIGLLILALLATSSFCQSGSAEENKTSGSDATKAKASVKKVAQKGTASKLLEVAKDLIDAEAESKSEAELETDPMRGLQSAAMREQAAAWGHWGDKPSKYSTWTNHSNRLVPLYTFGMNLGYLREHGSLYADPTRIESLFGHELEATINPRATYHDQTDVYTLQRMAADQGKRNIIVMIFDGMDWQTTRAAAIYKNQGNRYDSGRGEGLAFQDYRGAPTDFTFLVTTPRLSGAKPDVNSQTITGADKAATGGFDPTLAGSQPWHEQPRSNYLIGRDRERAHTVTDSAASATSLLAGTKTYNGSINVNADGTHSIPLARTLQNEGFQVGIVTSVPVSHATPACAYANNVSRKDYQDISRDLLGRPSSSHRSNPLPGLDVVLGGGWGEGSGKQTVQGENFMPGNVYLHESDRDAVRWTPAEQTNKPVKKSNKPKRSKTVGTYVIAERTPGEDGSDVLNEATQLAIDHNKRLLGYFGTKGGHLPFQTADARFNPTFDVKGAERYTTEDVRENPTLAELTGAALRRLSTNQPNQNAPSKFWLMVECGDVDWANHANNIDNSIGAVFSGEAAFQTIVDWVEENSNWEESVLFITSDHGHYFHLDDPEAIAQAARKATAIEK